MASATYVLKRQINGRGAYAGVTVCDTGEKSEYLEAAPEEWLRGAREGIRAAQDEFLGERTQSLSCCDMTWLEVDTTEDQMRAAGFLAVAKFIGKADEFDIIRDDGEVVLLRRGQSSRVSTRAESPGTDGAD